MKNASIYTKSIKKHRSYLIELKNIGLKVGKLKNNILNTRRQVVLIYFFGILIALFMNLLANLIHEQFKNYKSYSWVVSVGLVCLLIKGGYYINDLYIRPLNSEIDELESSVGDIDRKLKKTSKILKGHANKGN